MADDNDYRYGANTEEPDGKWKPTNRLRLLVSPVPGEGDTLQQLWFKDKANADWYPEEEWRLVERVEWFLARDRGKE